MTRRYRAGKCVVAVGGVYVVDVMFRGRSGLLEDVVMGALHVDGTFVFGGVWGTC